MNIRRILAVWAAKAAGFACKKMGRQGVTWRHKWKDNDQQYALCGTGGRRTEGDL